MKSLAHTVQAAIDELSSWLLDNTDKVFEEQPDIDGVRTALQDALAEASQTTSINNDIALHVAEEALRYGYEQGLLGQGVEEAWNNFEPSEFTKDLIA